MPERWKDSGSLRAVREITRIGARLHHVLSRRTGLSTTDLTALELLSREMMGPAEMARHLDVSTAAATGVVDRLEARGHVERRPIPGDRRRTGVHITDAGRREAWVHLTPMFAALQANDAQFTEAERAVVERYLTGAVAAINTVVEGENAKISGDEPAS
ncbi:MarR family winged helix-turn-helix transcriptional regulator [Nocardioides daphniae]|uniref:MarR family transcriptional regulator n=1 Tax=Nocardioides daphniae TaxID=402297 RepID=A0A4P7U8Z9_9ACTN|nr:MarR family transcriptional regulator [Nocardioides daphniae]QCC76104.1 MarR family transcriptional regulator [Nocardioides daphniae]GGD10126.1 hypothetical protein GCM10007231_06160 [Nocardioides daphniae]